MRDKYIAVNTVCHRMWMISLLLIYMLVSILFLLASVCYKNGPRVHYVSKWYIKTGNVSSDFIACGSFVI